MKGFCILLCVLATAAPVTRAADWPQWRGPHRDGTWDETGLVSRFSGTQIPASWRVPISSGYSGPTVAAGRVYLMDRLTEPKEQERVLCFDAQTGAPLWTSAYDCVYKGISFKAGPRASVTIHDGKAYALGTMGNMHCLDATTGQVVWAVDMGTVYNCRIPVWGICSSPLIEKDLVIAQVGGRDNACIVALDADTGERRWTALSDRACYSSPIVIEQAGRRVLVCWTGDRVVGLAAGTGQLLWEDAFPEPKRIIGVSDPVVDGEHLFVSDFWEGSLMLRLGTDAATASRLWYRKGRSEQHTDALHSLTVTPVLEDGLIYGVDSYGELRCLRQDNGDRVWESLDLLPRERWGTMHFVRNHDKVWVFTERGELAIVRLLPIGLDILSRAQLIEPTKAQHPRGVCWTHPAYANRHVFIRNDKELLCASLAAP